jgi:phosphatidylglycerol:prolipoprotein diacylglycerol transferase
MLAFLDYSPIVDIELGPLSISPHGVGIAAGFLLGAQLMAPHARRMGMRDEHIYSILTWAAIGAIVGARVAYVINHFGEFDNPGEWFAIWNGGISLLGGITGAVLAAAPRMRAYGYSFWRVMDLAAAPLAAGIIVGRLGDLIVGDHLGKPTEFFLGFVCDGVDTASPCNPATPGGAVHQPALYDLLNLLVLTPFLFWWRKRARYDGQSIIIFGLWYGAGRLVEDFYRIDETHGTGLTGSQWTAVAAMAACAIVLAVVRRTPWPSGRGNQASVPAHQARAAVAAVFDEPIPTVPPAGVPFDERSRDQQAPGASDPGEGTSPSSVVLPPTTTETTDGR